METFSWVERENDRLLFPKKRKLLISKCSYQWTTFKRSHRKSSSLKREKGNIWGSMKQRLYTFEFTVELQRRINNSWERASQRVAGTTVVLLRAAACLVQWEGSSSQCPPSVWAPRTFQPKRQEHPASWGIVPGCTWSQTWKDIQRSIWIMRRSEKLSNRVEEAQNGRDN